MKIIATVHNPLPIRLRSYDWVAFYDDDPDAGIAFAETERGAIEELTRRFPFNGEDALDEAVNDTMARYPATLNYLSK